jgi:hypothetical protein
MRHFEFMLSIARGFAVPEDEARQAMADSIRPEAAAPKRDAAPEATASKMPTHRRPPAEESAA